MNADGLLACLRGRCVMVRGCGPAGEALIGRLLAAGCDLRTRPPEDGDRPIDAAIISLENLDGTPKEIAHRVFDVVEALEQTQTTFGKMPRHVVAIVGSEAQPRGATIGDRLASTLTIYLTGHTAGQDVRVNVVRYRVDSGEDAVRRAVETTLVLLSGLLDAVRGQVLDVRGLDPVMGDAT